MNFKKYRVPILLLCVLLAIKINRTAGDVAKDAALDAIPLIAGIAGMVVTGPAGLLLAAGFAMIQLSCKILTGDDDPGEENLSKKDFLESQAKITDEIKNLDTHITESNVKLTDAIETFEFLEDMRNDLDTLREAYANNMKVILNPKVTGITKQTRMQAMLDYFSTFRQILRSFMTKYVIPRGLVSAAGHVNLFFDFMLRKERTAINAGDDCQSESTHTKLFKSYLYILKTITDAYVMAISAHTVQYQIELKSGNENAIETQNFGLKLLDQFKNDMKSFMGKAKWALDAASREIRNCGTFELKRGETFESISFAHILPKIKDWALDTTKYSTVNTVHETKCYTREKDVKYSDYEIADKCTDGGLDRPNTVKVFVNSTSSNWPYLYYQVDKYWPWGSDTIIGHKKTGPGVVARSYYVTRSCYTLFCNAFKKKAVAISTQIVSAKPGFVITGVRFRVRKNIIFLDIQQGKHVDDMSVDPETVIWTETPASNDILYLTQKIRNIELGAVELKDNQYLTRIQFKLKNEADGILRLLVGGGNATNWNTSDLIGSSDVEKSNELVLSECDNPEQFGAALKNLISKPPVPSKPYHIRLQPTDFKKDFGSTTIPFFDIRDVYTYPAAPLGGIGMYHHAVKGSGGYISLKLMALNLSRFVDSKFIESMGTTIKA